MRWNEMEKRRWSESSWNEGKIRKEEKGVGEVMKKGEWRKKRRVWGGSMENQHKESQDCSWIDTQSGCVGVALPRGEGFRATQGGWKEGGGVAGLTQVAKLSDWEGCVSTKQFV